MKVKVMDFGMNLIHSMILEWMESNLLIETEMVIIQLKNYMMILEWMESNLLILTKMGIFHGRNNMTILG